MKRLAPVLIMFALAACEKSGGSGGSGANVKHIDGGTPTKFKGVSFDLLKTWRSQEKDGVLVLMPEGANPSGQVEELYIVAGDPKVKSLETPDFEQALENLISQIQPGAQRKSGPS